MSMLPSGPIWALALAQVAPASVVQPATPEVVVDRQVAAYNAGDADAFARCYAPEARIYDPDLPAPLKLYGRPAIRAYYAALFRRAPGRRVAIAGRLRSGFYITDHEVLAGGVLEAIVTYEVRGGLIRRAWLHTTRQP